MVGTGSWERRRWDEEKLLGRGNSSNLGAQKLLWILCYVHEMIVLVLIVKLSFGWLINSIYQFNLLSNSFHFCMHLQAAELQDPNICWV